ncbi:MAG: VOC family protein [Microbacteriaceae bacterium]|nr:VOC family protein [Microbacteriaceae bacterium]
MPVVESYVEGTPCWADLASTDAESAKNFYGDLFGWKFNANPMGDDMVYYMATLDGKNVAGLMQQPAEMATPAAWTTYLAVKNADVAAEKAVAAGGTLLFPVDSVPGSGRMALMRDPGGAQLGLWQAEGHIGASLVNEPGTVIWHELQVEDVTAVLPFYAATAGISSETAPAGGLGDYTQLSVGGEVVGGAIHKSLPELAPQWVVYFKVTDADEALDHAMKLGATVLAPAFDAPGIGRMSLVADPQGAPFYLIEPKPEP